MSGPNNAVPSGTMQFHQPPQSITFSVEGGEWAIRITKDGVESNPTVPVDEGAKAVFKALEPYLRSMGK